MPRGASSKGRRLLRVLFLRPGSVSMAKGFEGLEQRVQELVRKG